MAQNDGTDNSAPLDDAPRNDVPLNDAPLNDSPDLRDALRSIEATGEDTSTVRQPRHRADDPEDASPDADASGADESDTSDAAEADATDTDTAL